jgi:hypothetical protein
MIWTYIGVRHIEGEGTTAVREELDTATAEVSDAELHDP